LMYFDIVLRYQSLVKISVPVAGIRKVTSHSAKNSIILASSFGRIFWVAWSAASMSGAGDAERAPTVRLAIQQSRVGTIWKPTGLVSPYPS